MKPLMLDLGGYEVTPEEREVLQHPFVGGVILFTRNFHDYQQLRALIESIRHCAGRDILIGVDHEGGRVQRFRQGFTQIPAMADILTHANNDLRLAQNNATDIGWLLASELLAVDIDLSFTPVLDIDAGSDVIGNRSFSANPNKVSSLAEGLIDGLHRAGMPATGKHFPGHGSVKADSHIAIPIDQRSFEQIETQDLPPFVHLIKAGKLDAVMPAHVIYEQVDPDPAGFSRFWLQQLLRQQLNFNGVIFSDDLAMHGASVAGGFTDRAHAALSAGCDVILLCNNPKGAHEVLDNYQVFPLPDIDRRAQLSRYSGRRFPIDALRQQPEWKKAKALIDEFAME